MALEAKYLVSVPQSILNIQGVLLMIKVLPYCILLHLIDQDSYVSKTYEMLFFWIIC